VFATTGPSPGVSVCTWVSVTLNGAVTFTTGAAESVDPVTAMLPVVPFSVHSGAPPLVGAAVGQLAEAGASGTAVEANSGMADDALAEDVSAPEPHAASVTTSVTALAAKAIEADIREVFTAATLQPRSATLATR
jgi:hypothetical protein